MTVTATKPFIEPQIGGFITSRRVWGSVMSQNFNLEVIEENSSGGMYRMVASGAEGIEAVNNLFDYLQELEADKQLLASLITSDPSINKLARETVKYRRVGFHQISGRLVFEYASESLYLNHQHEIKMVYGDKAIDYINTLLSYMAALERLKRQPVENFVTPQHGGVIKNRRISLTEDGFVCFKAVEELPGTGVNYILESVGDNAIAVINELMGHLEKLEFQADL